MATTPQFERRLHQRELICTGVNFFIEPAAASYHARTIDMSKGGMLMQVPPNTPAKPGQAVKIGLNNGGLSQLQHDAESEFVGQIVRVDRNNLLKTGQIEVAVKFC